MKLLENKTALITGATRGIGKGIAITFAKQGANVAFTYNSSVEAAQELEKELESFGVKAKGYQSNAAKFDAAQQWAADVLKEFGTIDILINNAAISGGHENAKFGEMDFEVYLQVHRVNVIGPTKMADKLTGGKDYEEIRTRRAHRALGIEHAIRF